MEKGASSFVNAVQGWGNRDIRSIQVGTAPESTRKTPGTHQGPGGICDRSEGGVSRVAPAPTTWRSGYRMPLSVTRKTSVELAGITPFTWSP